MIVDMWFSYYIPVIITVSMIDLSLTKIGRMVMSTMALNLLGKGKKIQ